MKPNWILCFGFYQAKCDINQYELNLSEIIGRKDRENMLSKENRKKKITEKKRKTKHKTNLMQRDTCICLKKSIIDFEFG